MIVTFSGKKIDYKNFKVEDVNLDDIIISLSHCNRFVGHSIRPYSVAEHSMHCAMMAVELGYSAEKCLYVLWHDAVEAYMGDLPTPLKNLLPRYRKIEEEMSKVIYRSIGLKPPTKEIKKRVKDIDVTMLALEMKKLTLHDVEDYITNVKVGTIIEELLDDEFAPTKDQLPLSQIVDDFKKVHELFANETFKNAS